MLAMMFAMLDGHCVHGTEHTPAKSNCEKGYCTLRPGSGNRCLNRGHGVSTAATECVVGIEDNATADDPSAKLVPFMSVEAVPASMSISSAMPGPLANLAACSFRSDAEASRSTGSSILNAAACAGSIETEGAPGDFFINLKETQVSRVVDVRFGRCVCGHEELAPDLRLT